MVLLRFLGFPEHSRKEEKVRLVLLRFLGFLEHSKTEEKVRSVTSGLSRTFQKSGGEIMDSSPETSGLSGTFQKKKR